MSAEYEKSPQTQRAEYIASAKTVVIKIGSAVLTGASGLNHNVLQSLAAQVAYIKNGGRGVILVSSGAVAAGKKALAGKGIDRFANYAEAKHAIAAVGQSLLMRAWNKAFEPHGLITAQVLLTRDDLRSRKRFQTAAATFRDMLKWGVVPIVNENDAVSVNDLKFGDNDCLGSLLVNLAGADLFVNLTSAPGVLAENPQDNPDAAVLKRIADIGKLNIDEMCGAKTELGSGGMRSKLLAARRVAQLGVPTLVLPGKGNDILLKAFSGADESPGTWICPAQKTIPRRKFWLAYQSEPAGDVVVDKGAAEALLYNGGSLLPGGVTAVAGDFSKGALLRIIFDNQSIGVGFSNYDSRDLEKIKGLKRYEVAAILGKARYPDVIHRDNLLLDAAVDFQQQ